jgi:hypothetical protein
VTADAAPGAQAPSNAGPANALEVEPTESLEVEPTEALEGATTAGPSRRRLGWRWAARGFALLAVAITVMMLALAIGMRANDSAIDENLGTATATVLSVSPLRTGIEFVDGTGATIRPDGGVLYPGLLNLGQQFVVDYSTKDPQIARVAGRTASVGTVMIVITLGVTYLITLPVIWWCLRRARLPLLGLHRGPGHATPPRIKTSR